MTPKQRAAVFIKAQATGQLKNNQSLSTYLADWPTIKEANKHNRKLYRKDPGFCIETQKDLDEAITQCQVFDQYADVLADYAGYGPYDF